MSMFLLLWQVDRWRRRMPTLLWRRRPWRPATAPRRSECLPRSPETRTGCWSSRPRRFRKRTGSVSRWWRCTCRRWARRRRWWCIQTHKPNGNIAKKHYHILLKLKSISTNASSSNAAHENFISRKTRTFRKDLGSIVWETSKPNLQRVAWYLKWLDGFAWQLYAE